MQKNGHKMSELIIAVRPRRLSFPPFLFAFPPFTSFLSAVTTAAAFSYFLKILQSVFV